ncbi:hypothetical protein D3C86_2226790 [compost metagenome]
MEIRCTGAGATDEQAAGVRAEADQARQQVAHRRLVAADIADRGGCPAVGF